MTTRAEPGAYTIQQVAELTQTSRHNIWHRVRDGTIPAFRVGSRWRIKASVVEQLLNGELS